QLKLDWVAWGGQRIFKVRKFRPVNGDKIQYHWDGTPLILIHGASARELEQEGGETILTDRGRALCLSSPWWRERFLIHQHEIDDADYWEGEMAGAVEGVGIRTRIYWIDWLRKEFLGNVVSFFEKVGLGVTLVSYEAGSPASL